ncbi:glutathione S-transferase N-terminal domain-containing protein [Sphingomonas fennica]|uniref:Glutathione S-transferase n=1 Tax=Edaphosphingomonas fennica TaxID=114404 RepID=A0A2T4HLY1_9SPHN|nr:glutathione S-transferase N-terminal domain-containing protein [Sphingomonas fennica]PTD16822.1 glutathione S-transferase [Sphingomonas fennica]
MKFYFNNGSCSLASHIALEESGLPFETVCVTLAAGQIQQADYLAKNPWGRVPALETAGAVLTENVAILQYIADLVPDRGLLPPSATLERARANRFLSLLSSTVHIAFRPLFRPNRLATTELGQADVIATGVEALNDVLKKLEAELSATEFVLESGYSLCDAYTLVFALWTQKPSARLLVTPTPNLHALAARVIKRPAVQAAMRTEKLIFIDASLTAA